MDGTPLSVSPRPHLGGWSGTVLSAPQAQPLAHVHRDLLGGPLDADTPHGCTVQVPEAPANLADPSEELGARLAELQPQEDVRVMLAPPRTRSASTRTAEAGSAPSGRPPCRLSRARVAP